MFEGFLTYGGMSVKEMEALIIGFEETMDLDIISQGPQFIKHCVSILDSMGVPMFRNQKHSVSSLVSLNQFQTGQKNSLLNSLKISVKTNKIYKSIEALVVSMLYF